MKPLTTLSAKIILWMLMLIYLSLISGCSFTYKKAVKTTTLTDFEKSIAQKIILDIRYFCNNKQNKSEKCLKPVTHLPLSLKQMISDTNIGGIILFSENIHSLKQTIKLTRKLQQAAKNTLFIAIDQEGGRVIRLPGTLGTSFSGNMAIGATYPRHNVYYSRKVGEIIGQELDLLGINVDFAPDIDVNTNADNPVINIRSFGEDALRVARLGQAMTEGIQQHIIATLKHFPGHGNTNIDSHTGLPSIDIAREIFQKNDLLPFAQIIKNSPPGMIMSAHIQYPKLDATQLVSTQKKLIVKPATMSHTILTKLLRQQLNYNGVIITDALNMASISNHFKPVDATINTYVAGADIALMPMKIRFHSDIEKFKLFIRKVAKAYQNTPEYKKNLKESLQRISSLKAKIIKPTTLFSLNKQIKQARKFIGNNEHRLLEKQLSIDAISIIKNKPDIIPIKSNLYKRILLVAEDATQLKYFKNTLAKTFLKTQGVQLKIRLLNINDTRTDKAGKLIKNNDIIIVIYSPDFKSPVASRTTDSEKMQLTGYQIINRIKSILEFSRINQKPSLLAVMGSPYAAQTLLPLADAAVTTYNGSIFIKHNHILAPDYDALSSLLSGNIKHYGQLPISIKNTINETKHNSINIKKTQE